MRVQSPEFRIESRETSRAKARSPLSLRSTLNPRPSTLDRSPSPLPPRPSTRSAFTLVELLVVIIIMLILLVMTVTAVNFGMDSERIRAGARQLQSYLSGARDRAIYAKEARGVRFLIDETNRRTVTSMIYVGPADYKNPGKVFLQHSGAGGSGPITRVAWKADEALGGGFTISEWYLLKQKGMLTNGARIRIPADGLWYTVDIGLLNYPDPRGPDGKPGDPGDDDGDGLPDEDDELGWPGSDDPVLLLKTPFLQSDIVQPAGLTYELQLPPVVLPNQEPVLLARGIVIDLDRSKLPAAWNVGGVYSSHMDILFSPRGTVTGAPASRGTIHFYLCDSTVQAFLQDSRSPSFLLNPPIVPSDSVADDPALQVSLGVPETVAGRWTDRLIVTLFTTTGAVSSSPVDGRPNSTIPAIARDPFFFAETGEVASQ